MRKFLYLVFILTLPGLCLAQKGRYSVQFNVKSLDCATGKVVIRLQVKVNSADSTFLMGDANYRFDYDSQIIRNPQIISQENFSSQAPASDIRYNQQNLNGSTVGPTLGTVSVNTVYGGSGNGAKLVGTDWITVSCIQFDIVNTQVVQSNCFGLRWHTDTTFPITGMNEYVANTQLPNGYTLLNVTSAKIFGNLQVCLPQYCSIQAASDSYTTSFNTLVSGNVITNDQVGPLVVTTTPVTGPKNGTVTLRTDGTFTYIPKTGYTGRDSIQYQVCKQLNPTLCTTAWIYITIGAPAGTDLNLTKTVSKAQPVLNDVISYNLTVQNTGGIPATGVEVRDSLPAGVQFQSATGTGTYNASTGIWTIGTVPVGGSVQLVITVKVIAEGTWFNTAEISKVNEKDPDSTPGNRNPSEDDLGVACFSTPISFCAGDVYTISLPNIYAGIQWYKDGTAITGATSTSYLVTSLGTYTYRAANGTCPQQGCCPIIFIEGNCCKPTVCVPVVITQTRKH
ncbi:Ig-like domain-containing protein [Spirosoma lituiforme]